MCYAKNGVRGKVTGFVSACMRVVNTCDLLRIGLRAMDLGESLAVRYKWVHFSN
jgi:hypothetical protein